jgi:hypothetical protein
MGWEWGAWGGKGEACKEALQRKASVAALSRSPDTAAAAAAALLDASAPPAPPLLRRAQGLVNAPGRDFLFSEIGLGGADPNGQRAAANLQDLAANPLHGIWAEYNSAQDPWRNDDYRSYRRQWFKCAGGMTLGARAGVGGGRERVAASRMTKLPLAPCAAGRALACARARTPLPPSPARSGPAPHRARQGADGLPAGWRRGALQGERRLHLERRHLGRCRDPPHLHQR